MCIGECVYGCILVRVYCIRVSTCVPVYCECVSMCLSIYYVGMVMCCCDTNPLVRSGPSNRRPRPGPDGCSLWTRYSGDSKTDARDDPEIRTGSCSEDQTAIWLQNRVISCEYLLMYHFLNFSLSIVFICYLY